MHIAIVRTEFVKSRGGAEKYAVNLARYWLAQGHEISVVCTKHDPQDADGMNVVTVSRPKVLGPFKHAWFARKSGQAARETGADATLCLACVYPGDALRLGDGLHSMQMEGRYGPTGAKRRARLNPRHRELLKLERNLFAPDQFGLYVANSEMIRDEVIARYDVEPERIRVVPNGIRPDEFNLETRTNRSRVRAAHGIPDDVRLILFSGMDFRRKGLNEAVDGFVQLNRKDTWFVCVGPGYTDKAIERLRRSGVGERAVFVDQTDSIADWYGAADVFVLPTSHDPSANAVTEALGCGTPVITSRGNGAKQHIVEGENGFVLTDRTDADELAGRMSEALDADWSPEDMARKASLITLEDNAARMLGSLKLAARVHKPGGVNDVDH